MTITNTISTTFCQEYLASNPEVAEQLIRVRKMLETEFSLVDAGFHQFNNSYTIRWQLKVTGTDEKVGELVHYLYYSLSEFSFKSYLNDDGEELISTGDRVRSKLASMATTRTEKEDIMELVRKS